ALHFSGPRKDKQFVAQNCSALNDQLLESELFGHLKGSFTGATRDKPGLFKIADGGTFFLDEVADMSAAMQVKLLRVLQEGTFVPVGGTKPEKVDVRIIAASNKDLREAVLRREFREDLFYRLHVVALEVPSLRERLTDLPLLVDHFLDGVAERTGKPRKRLHPELMAAFYEWQWPGNVRELENEIERLCVLAGDADVIPPELRAQRAAKAPAKAQDENGPFLARELRALGVDLRRVETVPDEVPLIVDALKRCLAQAHWVFTSGGIGPTHDDVTIAAVSQAFGRAVVLDERTL